nr:MAG TPA: KilA-N domain [Caudoviricetes sp.]
MVNEISIIPSLNTKIYEKPGTGDFINITELAESQGGSDLITSWLRNKNTLEFLGVWEKVNNPAFNENAFADIMSAAGLNRFRLPIRKWVSETGAIGIVAKSGKNGGTYAHIDIALEFAAWISAPFKLYVFTEFKRYKRAELERRDEALDWGVQRLLTKSAYRVHTDAVKECLVDDDASKQESQLVYATEADILNLAVFGTTAARWKATAQNQKGNIRDNASIEQLIVLNHLESQNALLIRQGKTPKERLDYLRSEAKRVMESLEKTRLPRETTLKKIH